MQIFLGTDGTKWSQRAILQRVTDPGALRHSSLELVLVSVLGGGRSGARMRSNRSVAKAGGDRARMGS